MHINISRSETGNNKGSSSQLVAYLEKENREKIDQGRTPALPEYWFNQNGSNIQPYEVRQAIDNNVAKLSKDEAKFFLVNISPSGKELLFLKAEYGEEKAKEYLKDYANKVMDTYAKNFKRNGISSNRDLVYFGKLENNRYYAYKDLEVRKGLAKRGDKKLGEQMHVQVIVSRKDVSNSIKLSPLNNSKGTNAAHSQKVGQFDRVAFKQSAETLFDSMFGYKRDIKESFNYANAMKNGNYEQKVDARKRVEAKTDHLKTTNIKQESYGKGLLDVLLGDSNVYIAPVPEDLKRRKKKKGKDYNRGL